MTVQHLEQRLRAGERRIDAETDPEKREQLIDFWIELLKQYQQAFDAERAQEAA